MKLLNYMGVVPIDRFQKKLEQSLLKCQDDYEGIG